MPCGVAPQHKKETVMPPLNIPAIEQEARRLRAEEMQRVQGLVSARLALYARLLGATALSGLMAVSESLRPLFSWNPQERASDAVAGNPDPAVLPRLNRLARGLFAWNPQARRSC
jgi:hypothetical protein